ncbi:4'-phosphopantetheinyl transferase superfamily protein [Bacillus cytotoxicus]|uniref:4'-phosphopantetheinyl transferase family protein n=1 Tax=Bacillus cytotoxicus TaxID=580165 RepID=UPI0013A5B240|nr:4'-phosphopantetheinyl transferase superfamily protein [Bacillus cytotoxicus]MDH2860367.1 4'-phosphopantetheinyl transferase superfamily protein [Bacillus cytotoxicus]MDH2868029.1 4'-phosphopantetheinyl transferase superfamily protein [Bacillus cytotoxicus]MDH2872482.1 4'-phosphopantetheinyl transferase superfamily protein [Bacillus cytotoxicus]MDH2875545.1 4'-phosphopantetheinyl transferase superfamily protein [Bacillus cytotoxicus]MDH2921529.1 4'-phosphopantetheinyl transferase superfamil
MKAILNSDELSKSEAFYYRSDQERFIVGRAILRIVLSYYLDILPKDIVFYYNHYGKPYILTNTIESLEFNITHSNEMLAIAIANRSVGIDIEYMYCGRNLEEYMESLFTTYLQKDLRMNTSEEKQKILLRLWTVLESYVKATGKGIRYPLSTDIRNIVNQHTKNLINSNFEISIDTCFLFKKIEIKDYICTCCILEPLDKFIIFRDEFILELPYYFEKIVR